jgi:Cof subfamily protein (haloacid dehalogenase superfamily)
MKGYEDFLLVSDLDGTLLSSDKTISSGNRAAISRFVHGGGRFAVATGRTPGNAREFLDDIEVNSPGIFFNGAMLADPFTGKVLRECRLQGDIWRDFAQQCLRDFPQACIEVYTAATCHILSRPEHDDPRIAREYSDYDHASLAAVSQAAWLKYFVCAPHQILEQVRQAAQEAGLDGVSTSFYSADNYLEFVGKDVSKGKMLASLQAWPGNAGRYVVAAGDFANDDEMLRRADCGVAPANAIDGTRQAADRVGPSCNADLWQYIIEEILPSL